MLTPVTVVGLAPVVTVATPVLALLHVHFEGVVNTIRLAASYAVAPKVWVRPFHTGNMGPITTWVIVELMVRLKCVFSLA
jgi:hypothetical protein